MELPSWLSGGTTSSASRWVVVALAVVALAACTSAMDAPGIESGTSPSSSTARTATASAPPVQSEAGDVPVIRTGPPSGDRVYLTIDDGQNRDPEFARGVRERGVPLTMFLVGRSMAEQPEYFRVLQRAGGRIENHTVRHRDLTTLGAAAQRSEICGQSSVAAALFGARPTLFRPPYGAFNATTLRASRACGIRNVVLWSVWIRNGVARSVDGREPDSQGRLQLRAGDIVLLHFEKRDGLRDLDLALDAVRRAGLTPALLPR